MAEAAPARDDNPALCCGVCLEAFDEDECTPKFLHCYHSYCLRCITQLSDGKGSLQCPTCRLETVLPPGGAKELRYNFHIDDMKSIVKKLTSTSEQDLCADHKKVLELWCKTCGDILCSKCISVHKTHDLEHIENLTEEGDKVIAIKVCQMDDSKKNLEKMLKILKQNRNELILKLKDFDIILQKMKVIRDIIEGKISSTEAKIDEGMISLAVLESLRVLFQENSSSKHVVQKLQLAYNPKVLSKIEHIGSDCLAKEQKDTAFLTDAFDALHVQCDQIVLNVEKSENDCGGCSANDKNDDNATNEEGDTKYSVEQGPITNRPVMIYGSEGSGAGQFRQPKYITIDSRDNSVYVSDCGNVRVQKFNDKFEYVSSWYTGFEPGNLAVMKDKNVIVCATVSSGEGKDHQLIVTPITNFGNSVNKIYIRNQKGNVSGIAINSYQQIVCSVDFDNTICIVNMEGQVLKTFRTRKSWTNRWVDTSLIPEDICIVEDKIVVSCSVRYDHDIILAELDKYGNFQKSSELKCNSPNRMCIDSSGRCIVSCGHIKTHLAVLTENNKSTIIDSKEDKMELPWGLCTTNDGHVLVCDAGAISSRIFKFKYA